ncbi:MAG: MATE family efflux transporter [Coriobacteriales bacterium]|nr:MATE family efflux transporter [Coriobacteriales bacterium]
MGSGSINKLLLEFSIPAIVGVVVNGLYNVIDSIFVGQAVGELGLAATTVAAPIMIVFMALSMLVGQGGNALSAIRLGEGKLKEAERILGNSVTLLLICGVIVILLAMFAIDPMLKISGATPDSMAYSRTFVRIVCLGFVFQGIGMGINNFIRTAGDPNRAMTTMIIGAVVCIVFNYLFVMRFGWGVAGSALATILGQFASAISVMAFFLNKKAPFRFRVENLHLDLHLAKEILTLGMASFLLQVAAAVVNLLLNNLLNKYGAQSIIGSDGALAVMGVVAKVGMFCFFPILGISIAAQPILGYNYGAQLFRRVRTTLFTAMLWATAVGFCFFLVAMILPGPIAQLFGIEDELLHFAIPGLRINLCCLCFIGAQIVGSNYFQATGQPLKSIILSLTRQFLFLIPLMIWLPTVIPGIFPQYDAVMGIIFAYPASDILAFFTTAAFVIVELRKINRLIREQEAAEKEGVSHA